MSPTTASAGTSVTITGSNFGVGQGTGAVWLGTTFGSVSSWSDTQVVAMVAANSTSGSARVQKNGKWSNSVALTVTGATISSVSPTSAMPGALVTISGSGFGSTQGTGQVWLGTAYGQVQSWSDTQVTALVDPASATGKAQVLQGAVWSNAVTFTVNTPHITTVSPNAGVSGTTAWTADVSGAVDWSDPRYVVPDFQGGLIVVGQNSIVKLDGITGQPYPAYTQPNGFDGIAVHTDGTIFAVAGMGMGAGAEGSIVGIDPTTGTQKFSVPFPDDSANPSCYIIRVPRLMIAGDGNAYVSRSFLNIDSCDPPVVPSLLRQINTSGAYTDIALPYMAYTSKLNVITNADQGVVVTWEEAENGNTHMAVTVGTTASVVNAPTLPGQDGWPVLVEPVLQAQDGSYVGTAMDGRTPYMVAFDQTGAIRWSVPNETPQIATADGGVVGQSGVVYDLGAHAIGEVVGAGIQSWSGYIYRQGPVDQLATALPLAASSLWANVGGGPSGNSTASRPWYFRVSFQNAFTFTPANPFVLYNLTTDIGSSAGRIKNAVLRAIRDAYSGVPVRVFEGSKGGDRLAVVANEDGEETPGCGVTNYNTMTSYVGWVRDMFEAQDALQLVIKDAAGELTAIANPNVIQTLGRGVGNIAAHELAHQFLGLCCTMDANPTNDPNARGALNATGCSGRSDGSPWTGYWPQPKILLHWEAPALDALTQCLAGGWRSFNGKSCHK